MSDYDVIVIGSGAGGGVAAQTFAERGKRVLILERGHAYPPGWTGRDSLRNHRYSAYGHNTGPEVEGNPRVFVDPSGVEHVVKPYEGGYQNNAMGVGGGTRVYLGQSWRFHPLDFRMASTYGIPAGSSLADWPIDYEELAPYYEKLEWGVGVSGGDPAANMPRRKDYPMPAMPLGNRGGRLKAAAEKLGWANQRIPFLINSIPYNGRPACIGCQFCVGFGCPVDAKNGSQNTTIPKALAQPGCELWTEARVIRLRTDAAGKVTGVVVMRGGDALELSVEVVVLAAGAIETARLLLLSTTPQEPNGIGNNSDWVGRNLQGHYYPGAQGLFDEEINDTLGPGAAISVTQFNHGNAGIVGGGMLADDSIPLPVSFASSWVHPDVPKYGKELKAWVRNNFRRSFRIIGPVQDIPSPSARVSLDPHVVDDLGIPVIRLSGTTHPETVRTTLFMRDRAADWLRAAGAKEVWLYGVGLGLSGGQHQAGTTRMAARPEDGVVDPRGRVFGHDNLLVCDGGVHVTNGGWNPVLTIMANSLRTASLFQS